METTVEKKEEEQPTDLEDFLFEHFCRLIFGPTYQVQKEEVKKQNG